MILKSSEDVVFLVGYHKKECKIVKHGSGANGVRTLCLYFGEIPEILEFYPMATKLKYTKISKTIIRAELKKSAIFSKTKKEFREIYNMLGLKIPKEYLAESETCSRVKGYKKPTTGKRVTTYARKKR